MAAITQIQSVLVLQRVVSLLSRPLLAAIFMLAAAVVVRRVFSSAIETEPDVGLYAVQAREWLRGGWPYIAAWDIHLPGEPALLAIAFAWFGQSVETVRMVAAITVWASGVLLARLVATHTRNNAWGLAAGLVYIAYSSVSGGLAANNEVVLAPFVIGGVALTMRKAFRVLRGESLNNLDFLWPGLCFGVALWIKQVAAPEAMMAFACLVGLAFWQGRLRLMALPGFAIVFGLACAGPILLTALVYFARGDFDEFYRAAIQAPLSHGGGRAFWLVPGAILTAATRFAPLLVLSAVGVIGSYRLLRNGTQLERFLLIATLLWFVAALLGTLMPPRPFGHHFLIMLPPLSILAVLGLVRLFQWPWLRTSKLRTYSAALLVLLFVSSVPVLAARLHMQTTPDNDVLRQVARFVREGLGPTELIYVVNSNPMIYILTGSRVPSRYVLPNHLVRPSATTIPGLNADAEVTRILSQTPQYVVVDQINWHTMRASAQEIITTALNAGYTRVLTLGDAKITIEVYRRSF